MIKKTIVTLIFKLLFSVTIFCQGEVLVVASVMPQPPIEIEEYLMQLRRRTTCLNPNENYYSSFVVAEDGTISNLRLRNGNHTFQGTVPHVQVQ